MTWLIGVVSYRVKTSMVVLRRYFVILREGIAMWESCGFEVREDVVDDIVGLIKGLKDVCTCWQEVRRSAMAVRR